MRSADGDRLEVLAAHHGAAAATAGMPSVVRDRRVADRALSGRANRRDLIVMTELRLDRVLGRTARLAAQCLGRLEPHPAVVDHERRQRWRATDDDDGI